jgi:hypothetical protein
MADEAPKTRSASAVKFGEKLARTKQLARSLKQQLADALRERDELKARPSAEDVTTQLQKLQGERRADKHRSAFEKAARDAKVRPEALDDLWELSKLDTSADEPDPKAIGDSIAEKLKARPYLVGEGESAPDPKAPLNPGPGSERGGRAQSGGMTVRYSQLADGEYMRANQDRIQELAAQGLVSFVD